MARISLLTGGPASARLRQAPAAPQPLRQDIVLEEMRGTLNYLRIEPQAWARTEATPLIEHEIELREEVARKLHTTEQKLKDVLAAPPKVLDPAPILERDRTITKLRSLLGTVQDQAVALQADLARAGVQLETTRQEAKRQAEDHAKALQAASTQPAPQLAPIPAPVEAKDITMRPLRDAAGYLEEVILSAPGRRDIAIAINRGPNGRMTSMKAR